MDIRHQIDSNSNYLADIDEIISRQKDNGGDLWATADKRIGIGGPFSTLGASIILFELGMGGSPLLKCCAELMLSVLRDDGRFQIAPHATMYPCHTAEPARVLCSLGYSNDHRLAKTFEYLLNIQSADGGWRCNSFKYGKGPETKASNPGTTLEVLDAFRYINTKEYESQINRAVEFLLQHWETRLPLGPCHFGIGKLFMQIEFPFFRYNLFFYVYVLSFFEIAKKDSRFLDALMVLEGKLSNGMVVVEHPNKKLENFEFCKKGEISFIATERYKEILRNLE